MELPAQLMLFAFVEGHWIFYGSYMTQAGSRAMITKLTTQHGYTRYQVVSLGSGEGQGITWS